MTAAGGRRKGCRKDRNTFWREWVERYVHRCRKERRRRHTDHVFTAQWAPVTTPTVTPTVSPRPTVTPVPGTPVNLGSTNSTLVGAKTADSSHMMQWLIILLAAAAGLTGMGVYRKKRRNG